MTDEQILKLISSHIICHYSDGYPYWTCLGHKSVNVYLDGLFIMNPSRDNLPCKTPFECYLKSKSFREHLKLLAVIPT